MKLKKVNFLRAKLVNLNFLNVFLELSSVISTQILTKTLILFLYRGAFIPFRYKKTTLYFIYKLIGQVLTKN